jgi:tRNA threonylcarbamoyladenosine biosynthesis protein TsaB
VLLAIDTSTSWISLALYDGTFVHYEETWQSQHHHTVELAPAIEQIFARTGTKGNNLKGIAVAIGPGSFTSLRIGLAAAKGFALGLKIPVIGVPSLEVIAAAQPLDMEKTLLAVLHAGRTRLAFSKYRVENGGWVKQSGPDLITPQELVQSITEPTLISGELSENARAVIGRRWKNALIASPARCLRRAGFLAELGWERLLKGQVDDPVSLSPIYLNTSKTPLPS